MTKHKGYTENKTQYAVISDSNVVCRRLLQINCDVWMGYVEFIIYSPSNLALLII